MIYRELQPQNYETMSKVTTRGSAICIIVYTLAAIFGYIALISSPEELDGLMEKHNILEINYQSYAFTISTFLLIFTVSSSCIPFILVCKDSFEELVYGDTPMT